MTLSRLSLFLRLAGRRDVLVRDLVKETGMNQSTIARSLALLADRPQRGRRDGLGLVAMTPDPDDPRRMFINLTPRGKKLLSELAELE